MTPIDFESAVLNPQKWRESLPPSDRQGLDDALKFETDQEAGMKRLLAVGYVADKTGADSYEVANHFDVLYRPAFAKEALGMAEPPKDDGEFFGALQGKLTGDRDAKTILEDARTDGFRAAIAADGSASGIKQLDLWKQSASGKPGYVEKHSADWLASYNGFVEALAPHRPMIKGAVAAMEKEMDGAGDDATKATLADVREKLIDMPDNLRPLVIGAMMRIGEKTGDKADKLGVPDLASKRIGAAIVSLVQQAGEGAYRFGEKSFAGGQAVESALQQVPEEGTVTTTLAAIETPEQARQFVSESLNQTAAAQLSGGDDFGGMSPVPEGKALKLSPETTRLIQTAKERAARAVRVDREIQDIALSTDPIKSVVASTAGTSIAIMAPLSISPLMALPMASLYQNVEYEDLSRKYPDMKPGDRAAIAAISGASQAPLDLVELGALKRLPSLSQFIEKGISGALVKDVLKQAGKSYVVENVVELLQDYSTPVVQSLYSALAKDIPGVDWAREREQFWQSRADVAIGMLSLTLIGLGHSSVEGWRAGKSALELNQSLGQWGAVEADRVKIVDALTSGDNAKAATLIQEAVPNRSAQIAAEFGNEAQASRIESQAVIAKAEAMGMLPRIRRDGEGFAVQVGNEAPLRVGSWDEAQRLVLGHLNDYERQQQADVAAIAGELIDRGTAPEAWVQSPHEDRQVKDEVKAGSVTEAEALEAVKVANQLDGLTGAESDAMTRGVLGTNKAEFIDTVRTMVSRGFQQASVLTPIEEVIEGRWKEGLRVGHYTHAQGKTWVGMAEQAMGEKLLTTDREATPREMLEAISKIVIADVVGRRKQDGAHFAPGLISRGLTAQLGGYRQRLGDAQADMNAKEVGKFRAFLRAWRAMIGQAMRRGRQLLKARAEGKLGDDFDAMLDDLMGANPEARFAGDVEKAAKELLGSDDQTFSLAPSTAEALPNVPRWQEFQDELKAAREGFASQMPDAADKSPEAEARRAEVTAASKAKGAELAAAFHAANPDAQAIIDQRKAAGEVIGAPIPPAWTDVEYFPGGNSKVLVRGRDSAGRPQAFYSSEHSQAALAAKFERNKRVNAAMPNMLERITAGIAKGDEEASVLRLIHLTGFRNGGEGDGNAKVKAYGASSLRAEHVTIDGDTAHFDFIGKLGVHQVHDIKDAALAADLATRKARGGELFRTNATKVLAYLKTIGEPDFIVHDIRTWNATRLAQRLIAAEPAPTSEIDYWLKRDAVGDVVARKLGDTRKVVLESYIDPIVFAKWQESATVEDAGNRPRYSRKDAEARGSAGQLGRSFEEHERALRDEHLPSARVASTARDGTGRVAQGEFTFSLAPVAKWGQKDTFSNDFLGSEGWKGFRDAIAVIDPKAGGKNGGLTSQATSRSTANTEVTRLWQAGLSARPLRVESKRGGEHTVEFRATRAFKETFPETYGGKFNPGNPATLLPATPLEYLKRWRAFNEVFNGDVRFEGVVMHPNGMVSLQISQPLITGPKPERADLEKTLADDGWANVAIGTWTKKTSRGLVRITDVKPDNFAVVDGVTVPLDVIVTLEDAAGTSFSLAPSQRLDLVAQGLRETLDARPDGTRKYLEKANTNLRKLRERWATMPERIAKADLDKQQKRIVELRRDELEAELVGEVERDLGHVMNSPEMAKLTEHPLADLLRTSASRRKRYYAWRLELPSRWRKRQLERNGEIGGDYDGADGLPAIWFQGTEAPDQLAAEAFAAGLITEDSTDALWRGIGQMFDEVSKNKEALHKAQGYVREAKAKAKEEAEYEGKAWRFEQDAIQDRLGSPRQAALRDVAALEAITYALPPEVRAKLPSGIAGFAGAVGDKFFAEKVKQRAKQIDKALQAHWREKNEESLTSLLARGQGKREPGEKPQGTAGVAVHEYFQEVAKVVAMDPLTLAKERAGIDMALAEATGSDDELKWIELGQIHDTWGGFHELHVAAQAQALDAGWEFFNTGRREWIQAEMKRLKATRENSGLIVDQLGQGIYEKLSTVQSARRIAGNIEVELRDFEGTLAALLGREHPLVKRWAGEVSKGFARKDDALRALRRRWESALELAFPGMPRRERKRRLWEMRQKPAIELDMIEEKANPRLTSNEKQALLEAGIMPDQVASKVKLTEDQGVFITMTARQSQYTQALALAGFTKPVIAAIEAGLSPEAKSLREWMATEYDAGHAPLSAVFEAMRGMKMPKIANYSPGRFYNFGNEKPMDVMGAGTVAAGFADGFLKDRRAHFAQVKLASALGVFWTHQNEARHWIELAPIVREMRGSLRHPDVKRAIEGAWGQRGLSNLESWMQAIEGNGIKHNAGETEALFNKAVSHFAVGKLAWNGYTMVKQSMAVMNTALDVPFGAFVMGAGEVFAHPSRFLDVYHSPVIQRRLESGFAPEVRMLLDSFWSSKPGRVQDALETGMEALGFADALFATVGAAVAYESHAKAAERAGMTAAQAHEIGMEKMAESVTRTSQPQTTDRRSIMEHRAGGFGKFAILFMTEARQKGALWAEAWRNTITGKATARDIKNLAIAHLILAPMMAAISAGIRDWRDGPDDPDDDPAWELSDFVIAMILGPLSQVPIVGSAVGKLQDVVAHRYSGGKGSNVLADPIASLGMGAWDLLTDLFDDKTHTPEAEVKKVLNIMQGVGGVAGVGANAVNQAVDVVDQVKGKK